MLCVCVCSGVAVATLQYSTGESCAAIYPHRNNGWKRAQREKREKQRNLEGYYYRYPVGNRKGTFSRCYPMPATNCVTGSPLPTPHGEGAWHPLMAPRRPHFMHFMRACGEHGDESGQPRQDYRRTPPRSDTGLASGWNASNACLIREIGLVSL